MLRKMMTKVEINAKGDMEWDPNFSHNNFVISDEGKTVKLSVGGWTHILVT